MNTFLDDLFWEQACPFMDDPNDPLEAFQRGVRFAFDLLGSVYGPDASPTARAAASPPSACSSSAS